MYTPQLQLVLPPFSIHLPAERIFSFKSFFMLYPSFNNDSPKTGGLVLQPPKLSPRYAQGNTNVLACVLYLGLQTSSNIAV